MPGTQPAVEIAVRRGPMPRPGRARTAVRTASRFISGSPIPIRAALLRPLTGRPSRPAEPGSATADEEPERLPSVELTARKKNSACSTISQALRLRLKPIWPLAQKEHLSGQPDWVEMQTERRPSR